MLMQLAVGKKGKPRVSLKLKYLTSNCAFLVFMELALYKSKNQAWLPNSWLTWMFHNKKKNIANKCKEDTVLATIYAVAKRKPDLCDTGATL